VNAFRLNPSQTGTRFTYPGGMEGRLDLGSWLHTEIFYVPAGKQLWHVSGILLTFSPCLACAERVLFLCCYKLQPADVL